MNAIQMNKPILYQTASLRYFKEQERHCKRFCDMDVLLLVFEGVLRFSENGEEFEVHAGEYFIQKKDCFQDGKIPSDAPKYLYVHCIADWTDDENGLPRRGTFDYQALRSLFERLDESAHKEETLIEQTALFYEILSRLYKKEKKWTLADMIAQYLSENAQSKISLAELCSTFHFSKNHVINLFKKEYKSTPFSYLCQLRIKNAKRLLSVTSRSAEDIAFACGFSDYSHFYKLFKKYNNFSPAEYRKAQQN